MHQKNKFTARALYASLALLAAVPAAAVELDHLPELGADLAAPPEPRTPATLFGSLGVAAVDTGRFLGSDERVTFPLPLVYFNYSDRVYWSITSVGGWLLRSDDRRFRLGLLAKARGGIDGDDTSFTGIVDRDASLDAGVNLAWRLGDLVIGASWLADTLGRNNGQSASLRLSVPIRLNERWTTTPGVSAEWLDRNMVDYYYGVTPAETTGGAPLYTGTATTHLRAGWSLGYRINRQWRLLGGVSWTRLGAGVADSPLVARAENLLAWAGFTWSFGRVH